LRRLINSEFHLAVASGGLMAVKADFATETFLFFVQF
jgi:hypothetical protein